MNLPKEIYFPLNMGRDKKDNSKTRVTAPFNYSISLRDWLIENGFLPDLELEGPNYVYVQAEGTPQQNAVELQEAYDLAKSRVATEGAQTVVVGPGDFDFATDFLADADQVSITSLVAAPTVKFTGVGTINVTGQFCGFLGIDTGSKPFIVGDNVGA